MAVNTDEAASKALKDSEHTIVQLKGLLEQILALRVEAAKLEFELLGLYHTLCPNILEVLREDERNANISHNDGGQK